MEANVAIKEHLSPQLSTDEEAPKFNEGISEKCDASSAAAAAAAAATKTEADNCEYSDDVDETGEGNAQWNTPDNKSYNGSVQTYRGRGGSFSSFSHGGSIPRGGGNFNSRGSHEKNWSQNNQNGTNGPPLELWVEAKTEDGKSYFYHALTRETTWNKPEGPLVKIMSQVEIEEVNRKKQQQRTAALVESKPTDAVAAASIATKDNADATSRPIELVGTGSTQTPSMSHPPPGNQQQAPPIMNLPPPMTQQPPPGMHHPHQPPPYYQQSGGMHPPPNFAQPPFGMPPPGYAGYPPGGTPWAHGGWNPQHHMHAPPGMPQPEKPAKNLIIKPGVIDPQVIARAAEWTEHRAPDGRPYYYHAARGESVWEKPQALRDMEAARMAAHSGATPQQAVVASSVPPVAHLMPNQVMHVPPVFDGGPMGGFNAAAAAAAAAASAIMKINESGKTTQTAMQDGKTKQTEEKRKKETEPKKMENNAQKPVDKSRPISSTAIAGTPWCVVWTGDARVFFYNPSTRTSVWERPEDLLDRSDVDKAVSTPPDQLKNNAGSAGKNQDTTVDKSDELANNKPAANNDHNKNITAVNEVKAEEKPTTAGDNEDEIIKIRTESESSVEEVLTKKSKISTKASKKADANEAVVEAEVRAAKERALVPLEIRIKQFKEMLREKDVSAFSTWEKELHKIVFDPRYLLITSKERKQVFEKYIKDRAEEERKEKRNKMRQKRDDFRKLMEDAKLHGKSSFSDFCQRNGKDERYKAIEKIRERESLFNEYIVDVRRREKEEKLQKKEQIRKDFIEMLRERSDFDRHSRWHDVKKKFESDSRYRAVETSAYREEYFVEFMRHLKDEKRRQRDQKDREREKERERDRERKSEKKERKEKDRARDRSRSPSRVNDDSKIAEKDEIKDKNEAKNKSESSEEDKRPVEKMEVIDEEEVEKGEKPQTTDDEAERLQKERDRQMRAEQSIREREKEVQRTLAGHLRERDKEREHHKRDEAIGHFNALLTDLVRNPDLTWKEVKRQLRKDHRWDLIDSLDRDDREKIFNEHIDNLMRKKREKFREMLEELPELQLTSSWKEIKKLIRDDPRYLKYNSSDKCEREFRDYIKDKTAQDKAALLELLQECKLITHKSIEMVRDNANHLKDIQDILKNDKRYLILEHLSEERSSIVLNYLEELNKRGPPPPPTASESSRRNKTF